MSALAYGASLYDILKYEFNLSDDEVQEVITELEND